MVSRAAAISIGRLDHVVLTCASVPRTVDFYTRVLGMRAVTFSSNPPRQALAFGQQKINLHQAGQEFEPKATHPKPGSQDICLLLESGQTIDACRRHLAACGVDVEEGPVERTGALGKILSVYVRDPDGNLIEVRVAPASDLAFSNSLFSPLSFELSSRATTRQSDMITPF